MCARELLSTQCVQHPARYPVPHPLYIPPHRPSPGDDAGVDLALAQRESGGASGWVPLGLVRASIVGAFDDGRGWRLIPFHCQAIVGTGTFVRSDAAADVSVDVLLSPQVISMIGGERSMAVKMVYSPPLACPPLTTRHCRPRLLRASPARAAAP